MKYIGHTVLYSEMSTGARNIHSTRKLTDPTQHKANVILNALQLAYFVFYSENQYVSIYG